ncbi:MAG: DUF4276 family protein [Bacillota bacterium]|nr:DUF4276 family protein [Bacillota bacterium]
MKFVLFVEGKTERKGLPGFIKRWLDPKLSSPVGIQPVHFVGWSNLIKETPKKAAKYLQGPNSGDIIAVIALLDLYGPTIYPSNLANAVERYRWGKKYLEEQVGHPKFRQFFAVHEVEAWLLSDADLFPSPVRRHIPRGNPEEVNMDCPPSKLLERLYMDKLSRSYRKVVNGYELFRTLNPEVAYARCPILRELLDEMVALARAAGL